MPPETEANRHERIRQRSYQLLEHARKARKDYNSTEARASMSKLFQERSSQTPYGWQLDVAEAILLGLDSVVIAGTGRGKTIPFMLPLLLRPKKMVIIISPLKVLQRDQVCNQKHLFYDSICYLGD
ncbi:hypothetical protein BYT27DRAFT_7156909 [Phlegmacium glaucopus]|nr:hypothetical protein BYT27DRAFT_7156909 [Phlegmacium glaucopus]